jgi:fatty-acyl-CoA synthase
MDEFGDTLYNLYGSTEVAWATDRDARRPARRAGHRRQAAARAPIVRIYDENGREVRAGETGADLRRQRDAVRGLHGRRLEGHDRRADGTGDVGYFDDQTRLFVEGRDDEMIVSGGENVFPQEVEDLIARQDGVEEWRVIGVDDEQFGQRLKAYVVQEKGASVTEDSIKRLVKRTSRATRCRARSSSSTSYRATRPARSSSASSRSSTRRRKGRRPSRRLLVRSFSPATSVAFGSVGPPGIGSPL